MTGIEPAWPAWKAGALPLSYTREAAEGSSGPFLPAESIGPSPLTAARAWAIEHGFGAITLTTFRDVSWNAPLYAHLGFRALVEVELTDELVAVRDEETEHGLDPAQRVCMRVDL